MLVAAPADPGRSAGPAASRRAGPLQVVKAVLSAFIGIRKGAAHEDDAATITPVQAIVTGIVAAAILVVSVLLLVRFIMS
jgi:hypothetical protein